MKRFLRVLFYSASLISILCVSTISYLMFTTQDKNYVAMNYEVTQETMRLFNGEIQHLHKTLTIDKPIAVYLNSGGGSSVSITVAIERIVKLQGKGRRFIGTIYGRCYSACASLFAVMDRRYMTDNAIYMQHRSYFKNKKGFLSDTDKKMLFLTDMYRLRHDAHIYGSDTKDYIDMIDNYGDVIGSASYFLKTGLINGIVQQPDIDEI